MPSPAKILDSLEADLWADLYRCRWDAQHRAATIPVLLELLANPDPKIYQRTMQNIGRIGPCDKKRALSALVPPVCDYTRDANKLTRKIAVVTLQRIGQDNPKASVPALIAVCDNEEALLDWALLALVDIGQSAQKAAECYRRFSTHPNGKIRRLCLRGLDAIHATDAASLRIVRKATRDANKQVREMAKKVLKRLEADG